MESNNSSHVSSSTIPNPHTALNGFQNLETKEESFKESSSDYRKKGKETYAVNPYDNACPAERAQTSKLAKGSFDEDCETEVSSSLKFESTSAHPNLLVQKDRICKADQDIISSLTKRSSSYFSEGQPIHPGAKESKCISNSCNNASLHRSHGCSKQWQAQERPPAKDKILGAFGKQADTEKEAKPFDLGSLQHIGCSSTANFDMKHGDAALRSAEEQLALKQKAVQEKEGTSTIICGDWLDLSLSLGSRSHKKRKTNYQLGMGNKHETYSLREGKEIPALSTNGNEHASGPTLGCQQGSFKPFWPYHNVIPLLSKSEPEEASNPGFSHSSTSAFRPFKQATPNHSSNVQALCAPRPNLQPGNLYNLLFNHSNLSTGLQERDPKFQHSPSSCFKTYEKTPRAE